MLIYSPLSAQLDNALYQKVDSLHKKIVTIDSHTDTPMLFLLNTTIDLNINNSSTKVDFIKMQKGGLDAVFFAVFLEQANRDEAGCIIAENEAYLILKSIKEHVEKYSEKAVIVTNSADVYKAKRQGKKAVLIGIENGYCIGRNLDNIQKFKKLGVMYITLSHIKNNDICDSSNDTVEHNGLSAFGLKVIKEMNRQGVIIDISHTSDKTICDVIRYSKAPVIASHSCARALVNNKRNLSDDLIRLIAKNGGVVQVNFVSRFLKPSAMGQATVVDIVNHIDHIVKIAGINHVGIGSDFDGGGGVAGCKDVSDLKNITSELLKRGYNAQDIEKIWGENLLRVMTDVQNLAE